MAIYLRRERPHPRPSKRAIGASAVPDRQCRLPTIFRRAPRGALHREAKSPAPSSSSAFGLPLRVRCRSVRPPPFVATKAAMGAASSRRQTTMTEHHDTDYEPHHASSPTDHVLQELALYGFVPSRTNPTRGRSPRAMSWPAASPTSSMPWWWRSRTPRLEPDLEELLWGTVSLFQRAGDRIERRLDDNEVAQRRLQREQDGSEVKSVELERLAAEGRDPSRTARRLERDARPGRLIAGATPRSGGRAPAPLVQPSQPDRRDDRQPRLPRREEARRERGAPSALARKWPSPAVSTTTTIA